MAYLHINNKELIECIEKAKVKMLEIEKREGKDFLLAADIINRMGLCVYDTIHEFISEKFGMERG